MGNLVEEAGRTFPSVVYACDFSIWKKPIVRQFFGSSRVIFVRNASRVPPEGTLVVWGSKPVYGKLPEGARILRLEDGFLRSVGLGADLISPMSWVIDNCGIYYDATQPSALEVLLQSTEFTQELLLRAASLRERVVSAGLTKYNVGSRGWQRPSEAGHVILVPGQVESDASLRFGAPGVRTNLELLQRVREANQNAYLVYKPHPDVVAGLRRKGKGEADASRWCNEVVVDVDMGELLQQVDEVHTLTSLAGFEALLRGKAVTCYGQPFYAGWGLTRDIEPIPRRSRKLSMDMLVACALILYPVYVSRVTGRYTTPERALDELLAWRTSEKTMHLPWWRNVYRFVVGKILRQP